MRYCTFLQQKSYKIFELSNPKYARALCTPSQHLNFFRTLMAVHLQPLKLRGYKVLSLRKHCLTTNWWVLINIVAAILRYIFVSNCCTGYSGTRNIEYLTTTPLSRERTYIHNAKCMEISRS